MSSQKWSKEKEAYLAKAEEMYDELRAWREAHPEASIDDIGQQINPRRRGLMGELLKQLGQQHGDGEVLAGIKCADCGQEMTYKGKSKRDVVHLEGETDLKRSYYHCAECKAGLFPPG